MTESSNGTPPSTNDVPRPNELFQQLHAKFLQAVRYGQALLDRLELENARVTFIRPPDTTYAPWLLRIRLLEELHARFALAPEILLVVVPRGGVQARDLERGYGELFSSGFRLDLDVLVVVDEEPKLADRLRRLHRWGRWIPWQPDSRGDRFNFPSLSFQLRRNLTEYDVFEQRDPVRGHQVIGRKDAILDLSKRLESGKSVGVFGLRKVGKTTLLRAVTDTLDPVSAALSLDARQERPAQPIWEGAPRMFAVWLDCQRILQRTREGFVGPLEKALRKRLEIAGLAPNEPKSDSLETISELLERSAAPDMPPLGIVLDEYDLLFEGDEGQPAIPGIEQVFGLFRAHAQETGKLSIVVVGRDPLYFQRPKMNGFPNPMLSWFTAQWVGPLEREGANDLLRTLGRRVGLEVGPLTNELARRWTGGHPLLHRQYGSALLQVAHETNPIKESIHTDPLCDRALELFLERDAVADVCREIFDLLSTHYRNASALLEQIATEPAEDAAVVVDIHGGFGGAAAKVCRNFGLLSGEAKNPLLPEVLRWYAKTFRSGVRATMG